MDKARKTLASALDGLRNFQGLTSSKPDLDFKEVLKPADFCLTKVVRHGFPHDPRCLAFDPIQNLLAVGTGRGSIRIYGDIGVDYYLKHESQSPVLHLQFLVNEGALISACKDDTMHLWNLRQKSPEIVHSLQMQKEQVTCIHLPFQSKWLYVGTDRGNVFVVSIETFTLSGYVINWNKAIDLSCRTHPGAVVHLSDCPNDASKLLIGFQRGNVALWNFSSREADRFQCDHSLHSISWHSDGRQFVCSLDDGHLCVWALKNTSEPTRKWRPHGGSVGDPAFEPPCAPIGRVEWTRSRDGDELLLFSDGMPDSAGQVSALTVLRSAKSATVLEMPHSIVSFCTLCSSPCPPNNVHDPYAVVVLLKNDLLIVDLTTHGYPCFETPYPIDIHESPVTVCYYLSDCPIALIGALTLAGSKQRQQGFSEKVHSQLAASSLTVTLEMANRRHQDGSVKFWQASGEHLQVLYRLKTGRHLERPVDSQMRDSNCFAVTHLQLCAQSRALTVAGQSAQVTLFRFIKAESNCEIPMVQVPLLNPFMKPISNSSSPQSGSRRLKRQNSIGSNDSSDATDENGDCFLPLKVRGGTQKYSAGYQPDLVCFLSWKNGNSPERITVLSINTAYDLMAIGSRNGLAIIDLAQQIVVCAWTTREMYGTADPYRRRQIQYNNSEDTAFPFTPNVERLQEKQISSPVVDSAGGSNKVTTFHLLKPPESPLSTGQKSPGRLTLDNRIRSQGSVANLRKQMHKAQTIGSNFSDGESSQPNSSIDQNQSLCSSMSSNDDDDLSEWISSLSFIKSYSKRNDSVPGSCLWVGTSFGSCIVLQLLVPTKERLTNCVFATPSGSILRVKGSILHTAFLDQRFQLVGPPVDSWRDSVKIADEPSRNRVLSKSRLCTDDDDNDDDDEQFVVVIGQQQTKVVGICSQTTCFRVRPDIAWVQALVSHLAQSVLVLALNAAGQVQVFSLPSLTPLLSATLFSHSIDTDDLLVRRFCFSHHGLGVFMCTDSELQKFTVSAELTSQLSDTMGELFVPRDMPQQSKQSFFKGVTSLFVGGTKKQVDRDELFGEKCGKPLRNIARVIPGLNSMDGARMESFTAGQAIGTAILATVERGEKLSRVIDSTEQLRSNAQSLAERSSKLAEKYEKKKWYNF